MSKVQWNVSNADEKIEELSDDELPKDPPGYVPAPESMTDDEIVNSVSGEDALDAVYLSEEEEEADDAQILSNARLRLEQGRLYEMLMTNDIFTNMDADPQAVKNVQREVKKFAKDRMEVMLGMKSVQEQSSKVVGSQFNSLEVEVLKTLAAKLSGGDTQKLEGPQPPPKSKSITPISAGSGKTTKAAVKAAASKAIQGKAPVAPAKETPTVAPELANKRIEDMTYDEKIEYNRQKSAVYASRQTLGTDRIPMPTVEGANMIYGGKALTMQKIESNFKGR